MQNTISFQSESGMMPDWLNTRESRLYFRAWKPVNPRGLLIFIHGAGEHSGRYLHLGTESFNRQIAFIAPDLRGFGRSEGQRGHIDRFQDYLDDLDELVLHIRKQHPQLPLFLFGHSLGALVVIRYVQQFTNKAAGVILTSPALGIRLKHFKRIRKWLELVCLLRPNLSLELVKWNETLRRLRWLRSSLPGWTADLIQDPLSTVQYTPRWITELARNGAMALSEEHPFDLPTLCLYDIYDPVVDSQLIEQFMKSISPVQKEQLVFFEGVHQGLHHARKDEAVDHIFQWLGKRL